MRLVSTVAEYQRLAKIEDHASRLQAWTAVYEAAHPDVFNVYYSSYSDPSHRDGAVAEVARISPLVREWEARAEALARKTEREFRAQGLVDELNVVLLVGNHTANAWIEEFRGRQAMFVALELPGDPPYDGMLFSHEAVHLAHMHQGAANWPKCPPRRRRLMVQACSCQTAKPRCSLRAPATGWAIFWRNAGCLSTAFEACFAGIMPRRPIELLANSVPG